MKNKLPLIFFCLSLSMLIFGVGFLVGKFQIFPYSVIDKGYRGLKWSLQVAGLAELWYYPKDPYKDIPPVKDTGKASPGLTLVTRTKSDRQLSVGVYDLDGNVVHEWDVNWFKNWPNATHLSESSTPKALPGTHVHGAVITDDGDLIFNFENLGLIRMKPDSSVVWRLPIRTHHSAFIASSGNLWVCSKDDTRNLSKLFPSINRYGWDEAVLEVDPADGKVLRQINIIDLLERNGLRGLVYVNSQMSLYRPGMIGGDILHLNDVEVFPDTMKEGFFKHGDIMVSLRGISTILVFSPDTLKIKFHVTGTVNKQHDPDFVDGNTITVFDNNPSYYEGGKLSSRIVEIHAPSGDARVVFQGNDKIPFFTNVMGKHQWLPNGNLLVTESRRGRGFELSPDGEVVWEFRNELGNGRVGLVDEVQRLTEKQSRFFMK